MTGASRELSNKVSIVGMGSVGTAIAYACLIRGSAGALALYDLDSKKVRAELLDLKHGSQFVPHCPIVGSDDVAVTAGSKIVIVTAGAKQHEGQTRLDLATANVAMAQTLTPQLLEQSPDAIVVFVTNPVDVITYAAIAATGTDNGRILGSGTVLDSSRFRYLIAERADLAIANVHGFIVGEHGDSQIPLWSSVSIGGVPADSFRIDGNLVFDETTREQISADVVNAAYEVIAGKGATSLAIGLSTARIVEAILGDQHRVLPVSTVQRGTYEISDVCLSLPTVVTAAGAGRVLEVPLSVSELLRLQASAATLKRAQQSLGL
ncbi:lactate dehydrogenase [Mycolicibacterium conceptionense]|jgi:L-lactate dehydrogenase|uniref:L-lactate dehydrogenase n=1 Tax=Mycolicibacterium conceptionense TaxID=451644 RepID=A0A0J8U204_9MYCO|nr:MULTISPECIES: L-lactate dehydrogenase [Mycolicibacterium]KMV15628.1 lactate dehydrogenase [Mycolicibacterium conceptionense]OBK07320.1 L-lactate dehydrogenase [Mycolicibacterium conceptionense]OMB72716.1 L-lactate dehydrogenase [Mycolicibacterium conceptionense]OMB79872.1 L-lactate dehydrogenase [Mycolicibacterium conceptionense]OMB81780.1 L-lactate dehydrogenase [Mycolicibacterium conceptionense]